MKPKLQRQKPIKGGRSPLPSCVIADIAREVERLSRKFKVSKSFVIAVALADQFGIDEQEHYIHSQTRGWKSPLRMIK